MHESQALQEWGFRKGRSTLTSKGASGFTPLRAMLSVSEGGGCEVSLGEGTCTYRHAFGLLSAASGRRSSRARGAGADCDRPRAAARSKCGRGQPELAQLRLSLSPVLGNSAPWLCLSRFYRFGTVGFQATLVKSQTFLFGACKMYGTS